MKKFMNSTETMLRESLSGFALCHRDLVAPDRDVRFVRRRQGDLGRGGPQQDGWGGGYLARP